MIVSVAATLSWLHLVREPQPHAHPGFAVKLAYVPHSLIRELGFPRPKRQGFDMGMSDVVMLLKTI